MKQVIFLVITAVLLFSCNSADSNVDEIADKYCNCFESSDAKASKKVKKFFKMVADGKSKVTLQEEFQTLPAKDQELVQKLSTDADDEKSKLKKCVDKADEEVEEKQYRTKDEDAFKEKLVDEMYSRDDCQLAAHVFKAGFKQKKKGAEQEDEENNDE